MNTYIKLPKKNLYIIASVCFLLVLFISLETTIRVKDIQLFEDFLVENKDLVDEGMTQDTAYSNYLILNLSKFFFKIVAPIFLSIHIYFTYKYLRMSPLFIFMWIITLLGSLSYIVLEGEFYSVFYYMDIFLYIVLIINILSLNGVLNKSKEE
nr:hypothetical protein [Tissierella sp.]